MHKKRCLRNTFRATAMFLFLMHTFVSNAPKNWSDMQNNKQLVRMKRSTPTRIRASSRASSSSKSRTSHERRDRPKRVRKKPRG